MRTTLAALAVVALVSVGCDTSGSGSDTGSVRETGNRGGMHGVGGVTPGTPPQAPIDTTAGGVSDRDTTGMDSPTVRSGNTGATNGNTSVDSERGSGGTTPSR